MGKCETLRNTGMSINPLEFFCKKDFGIKKIMRDLSIKINDFEFLKYCPSKKKTHCIWYKCGT